jgi:hypothetical protein
VYGDTKNHKDDLKNMGGKYNQRLKDGPGWIFSKEKAGDKIKKYIKKVTGKSPDIKKADKSVKVKKSKQEDIELSNAEETRRKQLSKMNLRSRSGESDLHGLASGKITNFKTMRKDDLIKAIILYEREHGSEEEEKPVKTKKTKSKTPPPKKAESSSEEEEEKPVKTKKTKSKTPPPKKAESSSEEEEEKPASKPSSKSSKSKKVESSSSEEEPQEKACGSYSYEDLVSKRLEELRKILKKKGIDSSSIEDKDKLVSLACEGLKSTSSVCNQENEFNCPNGTICNISTNPGICVNPKLASSEQSWLAYYPKDIQGLEISKMEHKGKQIVGSKEAINALRKKLGLKKYTPPADTTDLGAKRAKHLRNAVKYSGKPASFFSHMTDHQIKLFNKGVKPEKKTEEETVIVEEKEEKVIKEKVESSSSEEEKPKAKKPKAKKVESSSSEEEKPKPKKPSKKAESSSSSEEEKPKPKKPSKKAESSSSSDEEKEEEKPRPKKPARKIDIQQVENVLSEVLSGKKAKIEDFTQVQTAVLKCLGLVSA